MTNRFQVSDTDLYLVVNAGRRDVDLAHLNAQLQKHSGMDVEMVVHDDRGLLALQGPSAVSILQPLVSVDLTKMYFSNFVKADIDGVPCWITRTGFRLSIFVFRQNARFRYTGEDGFECSIPADGLEKLAAKFVSSGDVWLGGLGARDALRLEAGLCLYGKPFCSFVFKMSFRERY